jgi:hypothetical protein
MIAVGAIVVVIILLVLLIHHVQVNSTKNSLKAYAANVNSLIADSDNTGADMFTRLQSGELNSNQIGTLQSQLATDSENARTQLAHAQALSAPGQVADAQSNLVQTMQLRLDGISQIANNIQAANSAKTSQDAIYAITVGTSLLYASDVLYKTFVTTGIAKALNGANLPIGGPTGAQINAGQILPDLGWLQKTFVSLKIGATLPTKVANTAGPGLHGHSLNYVTVGTTQLDDTEGVTNTVPASPAPTFSLNVTNGGVSPEYQVECKVTIEGLSDVGTAKIAETMPGQVTDCNVPLPFPPTSGTYKVTASIAKVPGEANTENNSMTFVIDFN